MLAIARDSGRAVLLRGINSRRVRDLIHKVRNPPSSDRHVLPATVISLSSRVLLYTSSRAGIILS